MAGLVAQIGSYIAQNPAIALGIGEVVGSGVQSLVNWGEGQSDREERKERFQEEAKKTGEFLEKESKLASQERKEIFGLEKERSADVLEKELNYLSKLADKNIDLFNAYYGNLAKRRQELLAQGLTREEIPEFFNQVLASRQSIMSNATSVPQSYYAGASTNSNLDALRSQRMQNYQQAFTPLQQERRLNQRDTGMTSAVRNLANVYIASMKRPKEKNLVNVDRGMSSSLDRMSMANPQLAAKVMRRKDVAMGQVKKFESLIGKPMLEEEDLMGLNKSELLELAKARGVPVSATVKKKTLKFKLKKPVAQAIAEKGGYGGGLSPQQLEKVKSRGPLFSPVKVEEKKKQ
jgi:hypothetical protein